MQRPPTRRMDLGHAARLGAVLFYQYVREAWSLLSFPLRKLYSRH